MKNNYTCKLKSLLIILICSIALSASAVPTIKLVATKGTCPANGIITTTATGTSGDVFYAIKLTSELVFSPQQESNIFSNLASGTYHVAVYDASGTTISPQIVLANATPAALKLNTPVPGNLNPTACADDGSIALSVNSGGVKPFLFHLKDGPTSLPDTATNGYSATNAAKFLQLSTGVYSVDVTDGCGTTLTAQNISVTSKYNISGHDLDVYELAGTTTYEADVSNPCGISFRRSAANVYLRDTNGDTLFRRSSKTEMPPDYPIQGRIEYPEGSGQYTPWGSFTNYTLPASIYKPSLNKFRQQLKNPCNENDIVSSSVYVLPYPYEARQTPCGWEIYRRITNFNCGGDIGIELSLTTDPTQKYTYTWDGVGDLYKLDMDNVPGGLYNVRITTANDTYQSATQVNTNGLLRVDMRADVYNYTRDKGCDFTTGGIRVSDIPAGNTTSITYTMLSGPVSRNPVTNTGNLTLWDDLPPGTYQVEVDRGADCGKTTETKTLTMPYSGFDAGELSYMPGSTCGTYNITGKGWYLAPDGSVSNAITAYGVTVFNVNTGAVVSDASATTASNTSFIVTKGVIPSGSYRVAFSSHSPGVASCFYVERFITIPPYTPLAIDVNKSGGVVCTGGIGELHVATTGGSGQPVSFRLRPASSQNESDFTPYQTSPDFPNLAAGEYTVQAKDDCGLVITQNLNLVLTTNSAQIIASGVDINSGEVLEVCPTSNVTLALKIIGRATDIRWKYPDGTEVVAETITIPGFSVDDEGIYTASYLSGGCAWESSITLNLKPNKPEFTYDESFILCPPNSLNLTTLTPEAGSIADLVMSYWNNDYTLNITATANAVTSAGIYRIVGTNQYGCSDSSGVKVNVPPVTTTWIAKGDANNWNDENNWDNGIPAACSDVIIPDQSTFVEVTTPHYPILQLGSETYPAATCDTILFKMGGEVEKTNYLTYNFAKAELTLQPNQWYTLAPVLQQQYSGDYLENLSKYRINPEIFIMYYQTGNPETGTARVVSKFTGFYNNTDELLKLTTGHAIWVDNGTRSDSEFTLHFPKDSTQYAYYNNPSNAITRYSGIMQRDKRGRFIYEGNSTYVSRGDGSFEQTIENSDFSQQLIIGNPFMSHMDVAEFQIVNTPLMGASFGIWKRSSYEAYIVNGDGTITSTDGGENGFLIPPTQSFIMGSNGTFTDPLLFTPAMSVTQPETSLRSTSSRRPLAPDVLRVEILREGIRESGLALRYKTGASRQYSKEKDAWTIVPELVGSYVLLYSLVDQKAASIHTTGDVNTPIDLGIAVGNTIKKKITAGEKETYTIQIAGDEIHLAEKDVYLIDKKNNIIHNLTGSPYRFENTTGDVTDRLQLVAKEKGYTSIHEFVSDSYVRIFQENDRIRVVSSTGNLIREVGVYNVVGQSLHRVDDVNAADWSLSVSNENRIVIVKVQTEKGSKTEKIFIK